LIDQLADDLGAARGSGEMQGSHPGHRLGVDIGATFQQGLNEAWFAVDDGEMERKYPSVELSGLNVIKRFTAVSNEFLNKVECLSLASISSLVYCL
jgi:hypothetical protein